MIIKFLPWILVSYASFFLLISKGNYFEAMYTPVEFFLSITDIRITDVILLMKKDLPQD
jgi:hypothetical protein